MPNPNASTFRPRGYRVPGNELDLSVVDHALRVGTPVSVDSEPDIPEVHTDHTRRIIREVEVPYERKVRVPVRTKKIVQDVQRVQVPVQRLREVPVTRTVKEKYTDYVEQEAVRDKEVWVKKIVQEKYMKRVPVVKTREKQVQEVELRPYTDTMEVEVPVDREAEEVGFRIDTVKDTKLVEVEEVEHYKLVPEKTDQREVVRTHELGAVRRRDGGAGHIERYVGEAVYTADDVASISTDSDPDDDYHATAEYGRINTRSLGGGVRAGTRSLGASYNSRSVNTRSIGGGGASGFSSSRRTGGSFRANNYSSSQTVNTRAIGGGSSSFRESSYRASSNRTTSRKLASAGGHGTLGTRSLGYGVAGGSSSHMAKSGSYEYASRSIGGASMRPASRGADPFAYTGGRPTTANAGGLLGIVLKNAERGGCRVVRVLDRSPAYQAGVKVNDVVVELDNRQTNDLTQFRDAILRSGGLIHLAIKRSGTVVTLKCTRQGWNH